LFFLGLNDDTPINRGLCSAADVLQFILETRLGLKPGDKDMIIMLHEIEYDEAAPAKNEPFNDTTIPASQVRNLKSCLIVKGEDSIHTAMAKTVGLPLGIATKLILEEKIKETGLHIPVLPSIYEPVLVELAKHNIVFEEY
jgi:saccharopine dehydrogenase-like NADP-dependent oxidoreductase